MVYYPDYTAQPEIDPSIDGSKAVARVRDTGGDTLSFSQLSDRRFEVLAYRLKVAEPGNALRTVTLMQGRANGDATSSSTTRPAQLRRSCNANC